MLSTTAGKKEKLIFWMLVLLIGSNFLSLSVAGIFVPVLRFARQGILVLTIGLMLHYLPSVAGTHAFRTVRYAFYAFVFYLAFNVATSLSPTASLSQAVWVVVLLYFIYQLLLQRNPAGFKYTLRQFTRVMLLLTQLAVLISFVGGYVFGFEIFFDERFNYTLARMAREFAGVFGSNNVMGFVTFTLQFFYLLYHRIETQKAVSVWLGLAVLHSLLLIFIGNRASMGCSLLLWLLYFVYVNRSLVMALAMVTAGGLVFSYQSEQILSTLRVEQFEGGNIFGNRSHLVKEAVEVIEKMDFFGVGYYNQKLSRIAFNVETESEKPLNFHNTYLAVATELGFIGLLWIPGLILYYIARRPVLKTDAQHRVLIRLIKAFFLVLLVGYLTVEDSINSPGSIVFPTFWCLFMILIQGLHETGNPPATQSQ